MTDTEVICEFMGGPRPGCPKYVDPCHDIRINAWWIATTTGYYDGDKPVVMPVCLRLEQLRIVEEHLSLPQWEHYINHFATPVERRTRMFHWDRISSILHASAEKKIKALASAIQANQ